jgi:hypothetical protein
VHADAVLGRDDHRLDAQDVDRPPLAPVLVDVALRLEPAGERLGQRGDARHPLDAGHAVPAGHDEAHRRAVLARQRLRVHLEREQHVGIGRFVERQRSVTVTLECAGSGIGKLVRT